MVIKKNIIKFMIIKNLYLIKCSTKLTRLKLSTEEDSFLYFD